LSPAERGPSLRQILRDLKPAEVDLYLVLRETVLAISGSHEDLVRAGEKWFPVFHRGGVIFLEVDLPPRGSRSHARLRFKGEATTFAELGRDPELRPASRALLRRAAARRGPRSIPSSTAEVTFPLGDSEELAEGVTVALLLQARMVDAA
jgi:hypothetical protein